MYKFVKVTHADTQKVKPNGENLILKVRDQDNGEEMSFSLSLGNRDTTRDQMKNQLILYKMKQIFGKGYTKPSDLVGMPLDIDVELVEGQYKLFNVLNPAFTMPVQPDPRQARWELLNVQDEEIIEWVDEDEEDEGEGDPDA